MSAEPLAASLTLTTIEPPCGSNAYVLEYGDELLFIDSGFACYADEMRALLSALFPGFARRRKRAFLTHADIDHAGLLNQFDEVCMSQNCYANFAAEREGKPNFREQNPLHAPYCALSKTFPNTFRPKPAAAPSWGKSGTALCFRGLARGLSGRGRSIFTRATAAT